MKLKQLFSEQEFHITYIKKSIKNYKKENLDLSHKNSEVLSATSKSGSSQKETKNAETILNLRQILKVIRIIHPQAL